MKRKVEQEKTILETKEKMWVLSNMIKKFLSINVFLDETCTIVHLSFLAENHNSLCLIVKIVLPNLKYCTITLFSQIHTFRLLQVKKIVISPWIDNLLETFLLLVLFVYIFILFMPYYNLINLCLNSNMKRHSKAEQEKEAVETTEKLWVLLNMISKEGHSSGVKHLPGSYKRW